MTAIICFELIPEALEIANLIVVIFGIILGIIMMIICDIFVDNLFQKRHKNANTINSKSYNSKKLITKGKNIDSDNEKKKINLLKTGMIVSIGLAIHNFPEGLAIGSGYEASVRLGLSLAIAICFHDIPEGRFLSRQYIELINAWENDLNLQIKEEFWTNFKRY